VDADGSLFPLQGAADQAGRHAPLAIETAAVTKSREKNEARSFIKERA
jgi:hypothetical protein